MDATVQQSVTEHFVSTQLRLEEKKLLEIAALIGVNFAVDRLEGMAALASERAKASTDPHDTLRSCDACQCDRCKARRAQGGARG